MSDTQVSLNNLTPGDVAIMKDLAEAAADTTVKKWLTVMGMDPCNPIESQQTFAALRRIAARMDDEDQLADDEWVRRMRERSEGLIGKAMLTAVGLAVIGAAHTMWEGVTSMLGKG